MGGNTRFVHTDGGLIKVIGEGDRGGVTLKLCPRVEQAAGEEREYDEVHGAVSTEMDWQETNRVIGELIQVRDRVFGKPVTM